MPLLLTGLIRAQVIQLMPKAFKAGMTRTAFYNKLRRAGPVYRKSTFFSDWRTKFNIEAKKDVYKYVRKDRIPSPATFANVHWKYSKEYIYKVNTWSRLKPDEPLTERMVTLVSDKPLSPRQVEEQVISTWPIADSVPDTLPERVEARGFYHKIPESIEAD